jgi:hypothetical protein
VKEANALKAAYEIEHLILGDIRILLLQTNGLHGKRRGRRSGDIVAGVLLKLQGLRPQGLIISSAVLIPFPFSPKETL